MPREPRIYGYARVSTDKQQNSLGNQFYEITKEAKAMEGNFRGIFHDEEVSGGTPWFQRPGGYFLNNALRKNDTVIATYIDRVFRNQADAAELANQLNERSINLHVIHFEIRDINSPIGRAIFHIMTAFSQMEKDLRAERYAKGVEERIRNNEPASSVAPKGWKVVKVGDKKKLVPDEEFRQMADIAAYMRETYHWSFGEICRYMWSEHEWGPLLSKKSARPNTPMKKPQRMWERSELGRILERRALDWPAYPSRCQEISLVAGRPFVNQGKVMTAKRKAEAKREEEGASEEEISASFLTVEQLHKMMEKNNIEVDNG